MDQHLGVVACRWARLTLLQPYPLWLDSEKRPWTCLRDPAPYPLDDADICRDCPRWEPRPPIPLWNREAL